MIRNNRLIIGMRSHTIIKTGLKKTLWIVVAYALYGELKLLWVSRIGSKKEKL